MYKIKTTIIDRKAKVFLQRFHTFESKSRMDIYKQNLIDSINDSEVVVTFTTYVKER